MAGRPRRKRVLADGKGGRTSSVLRHYLCLENRRSSTNAAMVSLVSLQNTGIMYNQWHFYKKKLAPFTKSIKTLAFTKAPQKNRHIRFCINLKRKSI